MASAPHRSIATDRGRRLATSLSALAVVTMGMAVALAPTAAPAAPVKTTSTVHKTVGAVKMDGPTQIAGAKPKVEPPPHCQGNVGGNVQGSYQGKDLASVNVTIATNITCKATKPNQTMQSLSDTGYANLANKDVGSAPAGKCVYAVNKPCVEVKSNGSYECKTGKTCAGDYRIAHDAIMVLPAGWRWSQTPKECKLTNPATINCRWISNPVTVAATLP